MKEIRIAPSILSADFAAMGDAVERLEKSGADWIHCDVMDGTFVPKITFGTDMVAALRKHTSLVMDVHLMIVNPQDKVEEFAKAGADFITVHAEACKDNLNEVLKQIRSYGVRAGVAVSPDTPVETVFDSLQYADMLLIMSVYPGLGGQKMIERTLEKATKAQQYLQSHGMDIEIEMDGGIGEANVAQVKKAGVNAIVAGSAVFRAADMAATISALREKE